MIRRRVVEEKLLPDLTTEADVKTWIVICAALAALGLGGGAPEAHAATAPPPGGGAPEAREAGARRALALTRDERRLLDLIAAARSRRGLKPLRLRASLYRAAKAHSRGMIRADYFSHFSPAGYGPATRARRAGYTTSGYGSWRVGEVIAWGSRQRRGPEGGVPALDEELCAPQGARGGRLARRRCGVRARDVPRLPGRADVHGDGRPPDTVRGDPLSFRHRRRYTTNICS